MSKPTNFKHVSKTTARSWNRAAADYKEFRTQKGAFCLRVVCHRWHDTGELVMRAVKGDGRGPNFKTYDERIMANPPSLDSDEVREVAEEMIELVRAYT